MKKTICVLIITTCIISFVNGQKIKYGINPKFNVANQVLREPSEKSSSRYQWNNLYTMGISAFAEKQYFNHLNALLKLGYCRKGFIEPIQTLDIYNEQKNYSNKNTFDYLNLDITGKIHMNKANINPYLQVGFRTDFLLNKNIDNYYDNSNNMYSYQHYKRFDVGVLGAIGVEIRNTIWVDFEASTDILKPVRTEYLLVRNRLWSFNLGINLNKILYPNS
ncbi:MAG TPA: porin family protein [Bacteroidales bacterium]|nr:porin family protein [Bacteroidales bacterium]HPS18467.1 porin family protein [Bacteroidales bacterium]